MAILPAAGWAAQVPTTKVVESLSDQRSAEKRLRSLGFKRRGAVGRPRSDREGREGRSFPTFSSSFAVNGQTYPFTMVGFPPASGRSAEIRSVIIPLRINFVAFGENGDVTATFEPANAVANLIASPLYVPAQYPNGYGQLGDQMQRAAFWNRMDPQHQWHVKMAAPSVAPTIDLAVRPEIGTLISLPDGTLIGDMLIDFLDAEIQTILQLLKLPPDTVPIFVTNMVTAEALGYHTAIEVSDGKGGTRLQTYIFTSWLDPAKVPPLLADVTTFSHELMEWVNDPFANNIVPTWTYPPISDPRSTCADNPFLEVGDPQGNGPTYEDFPAVSITLSGVTYHVQQLVLWQWFANEVPSSAYRGWYTFPLPSSIATPATYCE